MAGYQQQQAAVNATYWGAFDVSDYLSRGEADALLHVKFNNQEV